MFLDSFLFITPMIIFYSLILFGLIIFRIKKRKLSKDKIIKFLIISILLAILTLLLSIFYQEKHIGGNCVWHYHGLPHYYLLEGKCFENEEEFQRLWNSKDIFLERDFSRLINGINLFYFAVDFIFWTLLSLCLMIFIVPKGNKIAST